jgi:hypothetical protein
MVPVSEIFSKKYNFPLSSHLKADVYKLREHPITHIVTSRPVAVLKKGCSFGVRIIIIFLIVLSCFILTL